MYLEQPLQNFSDFIELEGYSCQYMPSNELFPLDLLVVVLGRDLNETILLEMTYPLDLVADLDLEPGDGPNDQAEPAPSTLQFLTRFNFVFDQKYKAELALFMMEVNRSLPLGAFGLSPETGQMYLQYSLVARSDNHPEEVILYIVENFDFFTTLIWPRLKAIAEGKESVAQSLKILSDQQYAIIPMQACPIQITE
jgi:hypothetical protein